MLQQSTLLLFPQITPVTQLKLARCGSKPQLKQQHAYMSQQIDTL